MDQIRDFDRHHMWHPYTSMTNPLPVYEVESASGVRLKLADGRKLIDGMSSWWAAIHGYNHPRLNEAAQRQLKKMSHVMFGGLTHEPAVALGKKLLAMTPEPLEKIFLADSGSVAVEVAIKMALQYWQAKGQAQKSRLLTIRGGYHGDTFGAMAVCDPVGGMHNLFSGTLPQHFFTERPSCRYGEEWDPACLTELAETVAAQHKNIAALIMEPVVQGAGGMYFYHPQFLREAQKLCQEYDILLILDEIATGFGRTGKMWGCDHANIAPDIMCLGKALTGGYLTLAATIATSEVAETISSGSPGLFMHGPTFMANPLACSVAGASLDLLAEYDWPTKIAVIAKIMERELAPARENPAVAEVRILGGIGVVEMKREVDVAVIQEKFIQQGVWVRPFGRLVYIMPPYIIDEDDLTTLCRALVAGVADC
ncbi:MAG: adenosylmethionine--8-amino-7-oxononanoate transaminase [Thermodesulfobacteriota bacterium]